MAMELELKFTGPAGGLPDQAALDAALAPYGLSTGPARTEHVKDRYFDDPRASLNRAGVAVRRRMRSGKMLATFKTRGVTDGARHEREEIELPLPERGWPAEIEERISMITDVSLLKPYIVLDSVRTVHDVMKDGNRAAELSFDVVSAGYHSGTVRVDFTEIEVEALAGDVLDDVQGALSQLMELVPSPFTKLERAHALLLGDG